jgi:hypothetical protein
VKDLTREGESLRERFLSRGGEARGERCPGVERIWTAAHDGLPRSEFRDLVEHAASCPACTAAWRLAREIAVEDLANVASHAPDRAGAPAWLRPRWLTVAAAAAAVFVLAVFVSHRPARSPMPAPSYRTQKVTEIRALVPEGTVLSRRSCVLRWSSGPAGSAYNVRVTDEDLKPVASARRLGREE